MKNIELCSSCCIDDSPEHQGGGGGRQNQRILRNGTNHLKAMM